MNRKLLWAVFAIGLVLVIAPFALLPTKTSAVGEDMLNGFQPRDGSHEGDPGGASRPADAAPSARPRTPR